MRYRADPANQMRTRQMTLNPQMANTLSTLATGSAIDGYTFANPKSPLIRALSKEGLIEGNTSQVDPTNAEKIAFRLTDAGHAANGTPVANGATPAAPVADTGLTPTGDVPVQQVPAGKRGRKAGEKRGPMVAPVITNTGTRMALPAAPTAGKRGGQRGESYPFAKLGAPNAEGYDSFFVQQTAEMPNAYKTVKAAVASANKRYLKKGGWEFTARPTEPNAAVAGATVFRVK